MGNKRAKSTKATKGSGSIVDGIPISEMSREQLEPFVLRIQHELEREREERNFFQIERDKIKIFWEIVRQQLQEYRSALRNKDKQNETANSKHQHEIKTHQQNIKHLLYSQHGQLSELKIENMINLRKVEQDLADQELILLHENCRLKSQIIQQNEAQRKEIQNLFFENNANISKVRADSEKQYRAFECKYQCYLQQIRNEIDLQNEILLTKVQQQKNILLRHLNEKHENVLKRTTEFFINIIAENLALVTALRARSTNF